MVNPYREWKKKHKRLFKNAYVRKIPTIEFEAMKKLLRTGVADPDVRKALLLVLHTGLRASEVATVSRSGEVVGKGGKTRKVFPPSYIEWPSRTVSYHELYSSMKKLDHTVHDLRKIFLNYLVENEVDTYKLKEFAGWSSLSTADSYIKANEKQLAKFAKGVFE